MSVGAWMALNAGMLGLLYTGGLLGHSALTLALRGLAAAVMLWARLTFGRRSFHHAASPTEGALVTTGPYRYVRHPIYGSLGLFAGVGAVANWSKLHAVFGLVVLAALGVRISCEERVLRAAYPEYAEYAARTKRLLPWVV